MSDKIVVPDLIRMRNSGKKITMVAAYDFVFSSLLDQAGIHAILVGDSLGTVVQGQENTLPVTIEEIIYHSKAVVRGAKNALVVADMPFMSYQLGPDKALESAGRIIKESGVSAVKLEGGAVAAEAISKITSADIPLMGHIGLTPQSVHRMGGYKVQGRKDSEAEKLIEDALAVERAGAFAIVLEGIPSSLAKEITDRLYIPTIGIGAGVNCSGQVLVAHDLLGLTPANGGKLPKFVKQFAKLKGDIIDAFKDFKKEVEKEQFPSSEHSYEYRKQSQPRLKEVK